MVNRTLYQVGMISLITAIIWVIIGIYSASSKTTIADIDKSILEPVNPNLDQEVIQKLTERLKIEVSLTSPTTSSTSAEINIIEEVSTLPGEQTNANVVGTPTPTPSDSATILEGGPDELTN